MRQLFTFHVLYHLPIDTQQSSLNPQDTHWKWYYCYFPLLLARYNTQENQATIRKPREQELASEKADRKTIVVYLVTLLSSSVQVSPLPPLCSPHTWVSLGRKTREKLQGVSARFQIWVTAVLGLWCAPQYMLLVPSRCIQRMRSTDRREEDWDFLSSVSLPVK